MLTAIFQVNTHFPKIQSNSATMDVVYVNAIELHCILLEYKCIYMLTVELKILKVVKDVRNFLRPTKIHGNTFVCIWEWMLICSKNDKQEKHVFVAQAKTCQIFPARFSTNTLTHTILFNSRSEVCFFVTHTTALLLLLLIETKGAQWAELLR